MSDDIVCILHKVDDGTVDDGTLVGNCKKGCGSGCSTINVTPLANQLLSLSSGSLSDKETHLLSLWADGILCLVGIRKSGTKDVLVDPYSYAPGDHSKDVLSKVDWISIIGESLNAPIVIINMDDVMGTPISVTKWGYSTTNTKVGGTKYLRIAAGGSN